MRCLYLLAFVVGVVCLAPYGQARSRGVFESDLQRLNFKRLLHAIARNEMSNVRVTTPLSNEKIGELLEKIPQVGNNQACLESESCAIDWINFYNLALTKISEKGSVLEYQFETNITDQNSKLNEEFAPVTNKFLSLTKFQAIEFLKNSKDWDPQLRRMLFLASLGIVLKDDKDAALQSSLTSQLESIYAVAKVCEPDGSGCVSLDPELTEIMKSSRDYDRILWAWKGWHDATGPKMRHTYTKIVDIQNQGAVFSNYKDLSERWLEDFEEDDFEATMDGLFAEIKPLYDQLHAYARRKLAGLYGSKYPASHNPKLIPAHLLGNMWAQSWDGIYDLLMPFPNVEQVNLTKILIKKKYTPIKIFEEAENFFKSMGLFEMTPTFWRYSMIEKPKERQVQCHASATDFCNDFDFRIKMCTTVNEEDFITIHHEMGHIEYFMAYSHQPAVFKNGANSGFHEAIGDTIALSVLTTTHFKAIGVIEDDTMTNEQDINFLMQIALKKLAFLPFGYLMDKWRYGVFRGEINESNYNQKWWEMRKSFQGLEPPVARSENDFDPGSKYHIASFVPYARYFVSHFLQFQFYKSLCDHSGHTGPYHKCDFYNSANAGQHLKKMLSLGSSKHWTVALEALTGQKKMSAQPVFDYFKPLTDWLVKENAKHADDKPGFD